LKQQKLGGRELGGYQLFNPCRAVFGTAIFDEEIRSIILIVAMLSIFTHKMKIKEQFMTEQFGSEYASYQQKTKALVPFLW
jgi:protein-S-isoprenylcysteine O-methyltransferase Ste14